MTPDERRAAHPAAHHGASAAGRFVTFDPPPPRMLGQRHAGRGQQQTPTYSTRAEAGAYADGWYEYSARPAPHALDPQWRWIRLRRWWHARRSSIRARGPAPRPDQREKTTYEA
jgi:hypothetical protein